MQHRSSAGFSAVELLIGLGLVAILALITFPSLASYSAPFRVQSAGREVYSALQEARQQAVARGRPTRFRVVGADSYTLEWDDGTAWQIIRGPIQLEKNVQLVSSGGNLTFQPRGTVSPMSTLTISDPAKPQHRLVISVPITGLVRIKAGGG